VLVEVDDVIVYTISLYNSHSPAGIAGTARDVLPDGLEVQTISHRGSLGPDGKTITWDLTELDDGPLVLSVTVKVTKSGIFNNLAYIEPWNEVPYNTNTTYHKTGTTDFEFYKIDEADTPLAAVEFELYECTKSHLPGHVHNALVTEDPSCCWGNPISVSSDVAGFVKFLDLPFGDYMLVERVTKPSYQLPSGQWLIEVKDIGDITITAHASSGGVLPPAFKPGTGSYVGYLMLPNYKEMIMPQAGGAGLIALAVIGVAFLGSAVLYLLLSGLRKRGGRFLKSP